MIFFVLLLIETNGQAVPTSVASAVDAPSESSVSDPQVCFKLSTM